MGTSAAALRVHIVPHVLLCAALIWVAGCRRESEAPPPPPPAEVSVEPAQATTVRVKYEWVAQTEASRTVEIRARVAGFLTKRPFEEGGPVREGDLLFQIDKRNFEADLEIARAKVAQAEARVVLADVTLKRVETAASMGGTNQQEVDEKRAQKQEADASLRLVKGNLANAELNLSYTTIVSPLAGRIGKSPVYEGAYVDAGANSLLATVIQTDPLYVSFSVSEREILDWQQATAEGRVRMEGDEADIKGSAEEIRAERRRRALAAKVKVSVTLVTGEEYPHIGEMNFIDVQFNPETGTAQVRATLPNPEQRIRPGQFVKAHMLGWERPDTITVAQRAVIQQPTGQYVYVVGEEDKAELKRIVTGQWVGDRWVVESGLSPGERVVVDGIARVRPGNTVRIVPATVVGDAR